MNATRPVVHLVDDDESLRAALGGLLCAAGYDVRAYASAGDFLLDDAAGATGCLLLDLKLQGPSGFDLQDALARRGCRIPIVFMSAHGDIPASVRAMRAGAVDFLTKPVEREPLLAAIRVALARDAAQSATADRLAELRARYARLTDRERVVLEGVVAGKLNKQIADGIGVAERTVKTHRASMMAKLGADSPAVLGRIVEQLGYAALPGDAHKATR
jgi:FixJ family two-component response regulator